MKRRDSVKHIIKENSLLSNNQIYNCEIAKLIQKVTLHEAPSSISLVFKEQRRIEGMTTRSFSDIFIPSARDEPEAEF